VGPRPALLAGLKLAAPTRFINSADRIWQHCCRRHPDLSSAAM